MKDDYADLSCMNLRQQGAADVVAGWNMQTQLFSQGSLFEMTQRENIVLVWNGGRNEHCLLLLDFNNPDKTGQRKTGHQTYGLQDTCICEE